MFCCFHSAKASSGSSPTTIANVALSSGTETTQTAFDQATVPSGSYVFLGLDDTAVNWAKMTIWYYVN